MPWAAAEVLASRMAAEGGGGAPHAAPELGLRTAAIGGGSAPLATPLERGRAVARAPPSEGSRAGTLPPDCSRRVRERGRELCSCGREMKIKGQLLQGPFILFYCLLVG